MQLKFIVSSAIILILALIIHISAVLAIPYLTENDALKRLQNYADINQMRVLSEMEPSNQLWAFHVPDMRFAVCRYDVTRGPVQIDFVLLRGYWSVALYNDDGKNYYAADGYDLLRERASLLLLGPEHILNNENALPINVPSAKGLVLIRAPLDHELQSDLVVDALNKAKCEQLTSTDK